MKLLLVTLATTVAGWGTAFAQAPSSTTTIDFDDQAVGPATICQPGLAGGGAPVDWQVVEDSAKPAGPRVLAEVSGDTTNNRFPICIFPAVQAENVEVTIAFKPLSGRVDQAAGIAIRVRDQDNYYVTRANALEGNIGFYIVEGGVRRQLAGAGAPVPLGEWQTLTLRMHGLSAQILLNGVSVLTHADGTFTEPGGVGLWTKADSLTYFDDLTITPSD